jgi:dolichyl-phosphate beta-glucosyltransferase
MSAGASSGSPHVSYIIPAYNEQDRLPASLDRLMAFLAAQSFDSEIVVSNDGSSDDTPRIVRDRIAAGTPPRVTLRMVQHHPNRGKGAAIRAGMLAAAGDHAFFLDADLATPPEDSLPLLARLEDGADIAIGNRVQPDGSDMRASQPFRRRLVGRMFTMMRKTLGVLRDIDDTQCPLKGFRGDVAHAVFAEQTLTGWTFDAEVLCIARSLGYEIVQVPVRWAHVEGSRLRVRPSQAIEVARDLWRLRGRRAAPSAADAAVSTTSEE